MLESVVVARKDSNGDPRLVGYVVERPAHGDAGEVVARWQSIWDSTYRNSDCLFGGWISSYTGQPIPEPEMREWVDQTVQRIQSLRPRRVLEIGCGAGLLLFRVAPQCEYYEAVDVSSAGIESIRLQAQRLGLSHVTLRHAPPPT